MKSNDKISVKERIFNIFQKKMTDKGYDIHPEDGNVEILGDYIEFKNDETTFELAATILCFLSIANRKSLANQLTVYLNGLDKSKKKHIFLRRDEFLFENLGAFVKKHVSNFGSSDPSEKWIDIMKAMSTKFVSKQSHIALYNTFLERRSALNVRLSASEANMITPTNFLTHMFSVLYSTYDFNNLNLNTIDVLLFNLNQNRRFVYEHLTMHFYNERITPNSSHFSQELLTEKMKTVWEEVEPKSVNVLNKKVIDFFIKEVSDNSIPAEAMDNGFLDDHKIQDNFNIIGEEYGIRGNFNIKEEVETYDTIHHLNTMNRNRVLWPYYTNFTFDFASGERLNPNDIGKTGRLGDSGMDIVQVEIQRLICRPDAFSTTGFLDMNQHQPNIIYIRINPTTRELEDSQVPFLTTHYDTHQSAQAVFDACLAKKHTDKNFEHWVPTVKTSKFIFSKPVNLKRLHLQIGTPVSYLRRKNMSSRAYLELGDTAPTHNFRITTYAQKAILDRKINFNQLFSLDRTIVQDINNRDSLTDNIVAYAYVQLESNSLFKLLDNVAFEMLDTATVFEGQGRLISHYFLHLSRRYPNSILLLKPGAYAYILHVYINRRLYPVLSSESTWSLRFEEFRLIIGCKTKYTQSEVSANDFFWYLFEKDQAQRPIIRRFIDHEIRHGFGSTRTFTDEIGYLGPLDDIRSGLSSNIMERLGIFGSREIEALATPECKVSSDGFWTLEWKLTFTETPDDTLYLRQRPFTNDEIQGVIFFGYLTGTYNTLVGNDQNEMEPEIEPEMDADSDTASELEVELETHPEIPDLSNDQMLSDVSLRNFAAYLESQGALPILSMGHPNQYNWLDAMFGDDPDSDSVSGFRRILVPLFYDEKFIIDEIFGYSINVNDPIGNHCDNLPHSSCIAINVDRQLDFFIKITKLKHTRGVNFT